VSSDRILDVIAELPVVTWRYKNEDESARHIGPFAEDFERLFGLGNGKTISIVDAQGVVIAAVQGLQKRLAASKSELEQKLAEKDAEIAELAARLAALEERLDER